MVTIHVFKKCILFLIILWYDISARHKTWQNFSALMSTMKIFNVQEGATLVQRQSRRRIQSLHLFCQPLRCMCRGVHRPGTMIARPVRVRVKMHLKILVTKWFLSFCTYHKYQRPKWYINCHILIPTENTHTHTHTHTQLNQCDLTCMHILSI